MILPLYSLYKKMSFVKSTIIRNMARKAIRVEDVRLRNTISKKKVKMMASEKLLKQVNQVNTLLL